MNAEHFRSLVDFEVCTERVRAALRSAASDMELVNLFIDYASWNGHFANGVSALASLIGNQRGTFVEAGMPRAIADRSNYVAGYFFDAARDEYDDHINPARDSHRCLAQATLLGMVDALGIDRAILDREDDALLTQLNAAVVPGYTGHESAGMNPLARCFSGMGYHLGSELLADREFSMIDEFLREHRGQLVQRLMRTTMKVAGSEHRCYAWIGVHSRAGGGVEADHFDYAMDGVREGLKYIPPERVDDARMAVDRGFLAFERDHRAFFSRGL